MQEIHRSVWYGLLDADMNVRYFGYLARNYSKWDKWLKIFVAITSSATVASWQLWNKSAGFIDFSWIWQIATGIAALAAIALPIIDYGNRIKNTSNLRSKWIIVKNEYEMLWLRRKQLDENKIQAKYERILDLEEQLSELENTMPRNEKLLRYCQKEVLRSRNLTSNPERSTANG